MAMSSLDTNSISSNRMNKRIELDVASQARIMALSEELGLSSSVLIQELLHCALGDAHNGFLSAYSDGKSRLEADRRLKARVGVGQVHI